MDVYSPSHPTDQDMDVETPVYDDLRDIILPEDIATPPKISESIVPTDESYPVPSSPVVTPIEADISNVLDWVEENSQKYIALPENTENVAEEEEKPSTPKYVSHEEIKSEKQQGDDSSKVSKEKTTSSHRSPDKSQNSSKYSSSRSARNRSRTPKCKTSKSPDKRSSRRRSSSHTRQRHSHSRRRSRSRERRHHRSRSRSRTPSRGRRNYHDRESRRPNRSHSRSRSRRDDRPQAAPTRSRWENSREPERMHNDIIASNSRLEAPDAIEFNENVEEADDPWIPPNDADEPGTPNISDDKPIPDQPIQTLSISNSLYDSQENMPPGIAVSLFLRNRPPIPQCIDSGFVSRQQPHDERLMQPVAQSFENNMFTQNNFPPRNANFQPNFPVHSRYPSYRDFAPSVAQQRPFMNQYYQGSQYNRFPVETRPNPPIGMMNTFMPPMNPPFRGFLTQPPPLPTLPPHLSSAYAAPPPPPFIQAFQHPSVINSVGQPPIVPIDQHFYQHPTESFRVEEIQPPANYPPYCPPESISNEAECANDLPQTNLLETIMSKAGLSTNSLGGFNLSQTSSPSISSTELVEEKSPTKQIHKLLSSAANTILTHFNEEQKSLPHDSFRTYDSPPPPPPPLPICSKSQDCSMSKNKPFIPPPLPSIASSELFPSTTTGPTGNGESASKNLLPNCNSQEILAKRRRSDFNTHREWQDRIALEVRSFIKPSYAAGKITKEECREILKKSVTKISRSGCKSINTKKIGEYIKLYLHKYHKYHKWQARQRAAEEVAHVS